MIRSRKESEDLLLSITKNCETPTKQTQRKLKETLEIKFTKSRETFSFKLSISLGLDSNWLIAQTNLEVCKSFFNIKEGNTKFDIFTDNFDVFSLKELKDEGEEIPILSNITSEYLQNRKRGPGIIKANKILETEKRQTYGYYMFYMGYATSPIQDFESYIRIVVDLDEDDVQWNLKQCY